jgi:hypothetical protein
MTANVAPEPPFNQAAEGPYLSDDGQSRYRNNEFSCGQRHTAYLFWR